MSNSHSKTTRINLPRLITFVFVLTLAAVALVPNQKPSSAALAQPEKQNMRIRMRAAEDKRTEYARNARMMSPMMFAAISVDRTDDAAAAAACTAAANDCS